MQHGGETFSDCLDSLMGLKFLVVSGFAKKTEKIPRQELDAAEARRQDYLRRKEHERPN